MIADGSGARAPEMVVYSQITKSPTSCLKQGLIWTYAFNGMENSDPPDFGLLSALAILADGQGCWE